MIKVHLQRWATNRSFTGENVLMVRKHTLKYLELKGASCLPLYSQTVRGGQLETEDADKAPGGFGRRPSYILATVLRPEITSREKVIENKRSNLGADTPLLIGL